MNYPCQTRCPLHTKIDHTASIASCSQSEPNTVCFGEPITLVVLDAHNDELEIQGIYATRRDNGIIQLTVETNAEPEA